MSEAKLIDCLNCGAINNSKATECRKCEDPLLKLYASRVDSYPDEELVRFQAELDAAEKKLVEFQEEDLKEGAMLVTEAKDHDEHGVDRHGRRELWGKAESRLSQGRLLVLDMLALAAICGLCYYCFPLIFFDSLRPLWLGFLGCLFVGGTLGQAMRRWQYWIAGIIAKREKKRAGIIAKREKKRLGGLSLEDLDALSGKDFEKWIVVRLRKDGIKATNLQHRGDFGIDVIAEVSGTKIGIQAKRWEANVGNSAVQQVVSGCDYHKCDVAAVVTQSAFTKAAIAQAERTRIPIRLIGRDSLSKMAQHLTSLVDAAKD